MAGHSTVFFWGWDWGVLLPSIIFWAILFEYNRTYPFLFFDWIELVNFVCAIYKTGNSHWPRRWEDESNKQIV